MKFLLAGLVIGFGLLNIAAREIGLMQPPSTALQNFSDQCEGLPRLCWYGIVPGRTTVADVQGVLTETGYTASRRSSYGIIHYGVRKTLIDCDLQAHYSDSTAPIQRLRFQNCFGIRFGDIASLFGLPDEVLADASSLTLFYPNGLRVRLFAPPFSLYTMISGFELRNDSRILDSFVVDWQGFRAPIWYCYDQFKVHGVDAC